MLANVLFSSKSCSKHQLSKDYRQGDVLTHLLPLLIKIIMLKGE